jgi:hypothetical protein
MKTLTLKYAGTCETCGAALDAGTLAHWHGKGRITCPTCEPVTLTPEQYAAKREAKAERYQGYATNASARAQGASDRRHAIADMIPLGQPILVGHHSERGHRRDIATMDRAMRREIDETEKAEHWQRRARAVLSDRAIHSDDPEAADKLRAKIAELEAQRERIKAVNAAFKKAGYRPGVTVDADLIERAPIELTPAEAHAILSTLRYSWDKTIIPAYTLTNLGANIRRYKERLAALEPDMPLPNTCRWCGIPLPEGSGRACANCEPF